MLMVKWGYLSFLINIAHPVGLYVLSALFLLIPMVLMGSVPYIFILGVNLYLLFCLSFSFWGVSFLGGCLDMLRYYSLISFSVLGLFLFDLFVVLLRPVTLTLRVLINVSLGHFLIISLHGQMLGSFLSLVWILESFVYVVQSYVFATLSKSYLEVIF